MSVIVARLLKGWRGGEVPWLIDLVGYACAFCLALLVFVEPCLAQSISSPKIVAQSLLTNEWGTIMHPRAISVVADGGTITSGYVASTKAFAIKTSADGKQMWSHFVELSDEDQLAFPGQRYGIGPEYAGSVPMPDGSIFLCGSMKRPPGKPEPGLVTHLDAQGTVLSEQLVLPKDSPQRIIAHLAGCVRWGNDLAVLGHISQWTDDKGNGRSSHHNLYWVLILDASGVSKWERQFDIPDTFPVAIDPAIVVAGKDLVISASDGRETDFLRVDVKGSVVVRTKLPSNYLLIQDSASDEEIQIFEDARTESRDESKVHIHSLVTLNRDFSETHRVKGGLSNFYARVAYRLTDGSLILAGSEYSIPKHDYLSTVVHVDAKLKTSTSLGHRLIKAHPKSDCSEFY